MPTAPRIAAVDDALRLSMREGQVVRGLEAARDRLDAEARGLRLADEARSAPRGQRISRLLVLSGDGSERFHRQVEALLRRHGARTLAIRFEMDAAQLGALLFGPGRVARLALLERKEAVSRVLLALADAWRGDGRCASDGERPAPDGERRPTDG